jgi:flagellar assembly factor FliW
MTVGEIGLKGRIIGFEEYERYRMVDAGFSETSPFRLLSCEEAPVSFVVVSPFSIVEDYSFELEDAVLKGLKVNGTAMEDIAILCIVRPEEGKLYVNLRSPLVINTKKGVFAQIILQDDTYGVSVPIAVAGERG